MPPPRALTRVPATLSAMNPRTLATTARGTVIIGSGIALGALSAHLVADAATTAAAEEPPPQTAAAAKPKVVTIVRKKHVRPDPIIVYREVPVYDAGSDSSGTSTPSWGGSTSTGSSSGSSGSTGSSGSGGGSTHVAPAPPPAPAPAKQPAASSGAS